MLLNLCLLLTCTFLLSLSYREWPVRRAWVPHLGRVLFAAVTALLLVWHSAPLGDLKVDLRFVPVVLVTLRYGVGAGALVAAGPVMWRLLDSEVGGLVALANAVSVLALAGALRARLSLHELQWRHWPLLLVPYLGVGLAVFVVPGARPLAPWLYVGMLALQGVATLAVLGVLQARLQLLHLTFEARQQSRRDELTGLGNRQAFDEHLARLEAGHQLVLMDVDQFRLVNDLHGSAVGDRALQYVAQVLRDEVPLGAYRLSGEEFGLLLEQGSETQARAVVERVQARLSEPGEVPWANLSVSAGLATRLPREQPGELRHRADEALYLAKANGRNRLVLSPNVPREPVPAGATVTEIRPRHSLWQAQRITVNLMTQRRPLTDADWLEVLRSAVDTLDEVEAASLNIREGNRFRMCAVVGYDPDLLGLEFSEQAQLRWYGGPLAEWLRGRPRVANMTDMQRAWVDEDDVLGEEGGMVLRRAGHRDRLRTNLCVPVVLDGEVVAHLNLDSHSRDEAFTPGVLQDAQLFAQQIAALLQLQDRWRELDQLSHLHSDLSRAGDEQLGAHLAETAHDLLRTTYTLLLRYDPYADALVPAAEAGVFLNPLEVPPTLQRGEGLSWRALTTGAVIRVDDILSARGAFRPKTSHPERRALMVVPLLSRTGEPLGALCLLRDEHRPFRAPDEALAQMLAGVGARVMEGRAHVTDLEATLDAALNMLGVALEARDFETQGHTQRVQDLARRVGEALHLPAEQLTALRRGAALHDIGKLCIPDTVLLKPGALTPEEREVVERHAPLGAALVARIPFLDPEAQQVVRHHHERWDGRGYPDGLAGTQTPLLARVFALCDVYDALTSERPYKRAMSHAAALDVLREGRGTQFDPDLLDVFCRVVTPRAPVGN
ncbi:HD domain-containing phosphohydrolase [Deinococcus sedimenti]|uniref:HD domain-containing phosphohydrolase n=1 Tax=Deinococcus sedimenti TaxID=1867090 RepID=UPI001664F243|nr:HD domain-containing phosphohydrolase [Deinococcus sedimenti]